MKISIYYLFVLFFISCNQKSIDKLDANNVTNKENKIFGKEEITIINLPFYSDKLNYSNKNKNGYYIYDNSFKKQEYKRLSRTIGKYSCNNINVFIVEFKPNGDEYTEPIVVLFSCYKNKKIDSLIVYETIEWEGSLKKRFVIDKNKVIKVSEVSKANDVTESGSDTLIVSKKTNTYNLSDKGFFSSIIYVKSDVFSLSNKDLSSSNIWKGEYYFESKNKDNLKTSFEIKIKNIRDIAIKYVSDEDKPEIYNHIVGELIGTEKLKINFNDEDDEMGTIFLEKNDKGFNISGQPIYFINPGNDYLSINKIK